MCKVFRSLMSFYYRISVGIMSPTKKDKKNPNKVFSTYVTRMKNKVELIETYMEEHTQVWTPRKSRQLVVMVEDLRAQFQKMETAWDTMREDVDRGTPYDGAEAKVNAAEASMLQAIRQAESRTRVQGRGHRPRARTGRHRFLQTFREFRWTLHLQRV